MIKINVITDNNFWKKKINKKEKFFNLLVKSFPKKYRFINKKINLTVLLSNNTNIKKLNKKFRNMNKPTDVLSFPSGENYKGKKVSYLGDIVISYEFMNKPKKISLFDFKKKIIKIFIHGFLHLIGFDHLKIKDFKKMVKEEEKILKSVNLNFEKFA